METEYAGREVITDGSHLQNGQLKPNVVFVSGEYGYIYETNEQGLITRARAAALQLTADPKRPWHNPKTPGKRVGDHAGHLIAALFGGSGKLDNLTSQLANINKSEYYAMERQIEQGLHDGLPVTFDVEVLYEDGSARPVEYIAIYSIGDAHYKKTFEN